MPRFIVDIELGVEADSLEHAEKKRDEIVKLIKSHFDHRELLAVDSDVFDYSGEEDEDYDDDDDYDDEE